MAMSAMFVACSENAPTNGCLCKLSDGRSNAEGQVTLSEMTSYWKVSTCKELTAAILQDAKDEGAAYASVNCKSY